MLLPMVYHTIVSVPDESYSLDKSLRGFRIDGNIFDKAESPYLLQLLVFNRIDRKGRLTMFSSHSDKELSCDMTASNGTFGYSVLAGSWNLYSLPVLARR